MPVETATFVSQLVATNPPHTDGLNKADSHLRLLKAVLQAQFTNLGTVAVAATAAGLNAAGTAFATAGVLEVAANGAAGGLVRLDHGTGSGDVFLENTGTSGQPGVLSVVVKDAANANPLTAATLDRAGNLSTAASVNSLSVNQGGAPLLPVGCVIMWAGSVGSIPAGWAICDGTVVNGHVTPDLRNRFVIGAGADYTVAQTGGAAAQSGATDTQGTHSHTGATAAGGDSAPTAFTDTQGSHSHTGSDGSHVLTAAELPAHTHTVQIGAGGGGGGVTGFIGNVNSVIGNNTFTTDGGTGGGQGHTHPISADGSHSHNIAVSAIPAHTHAISSDGSHSHTVTVATLPPFYALCFIMKVT